MTGNKIRTPRSRSGNRKYFQSAVSQPGRQPTNQPTKPNQTTKRKTIKKKKREIIKLVVFHCQLGFGRGGRKCGDCGAKTEAPSQRQQPSQSASEPNEKCFKLPPICLSPVAAPTAPALHSTPFDSTRLHCIAPHRTPPADPLPIS